MVLFLELSNHLVNRGSIRLLDVLSDHRMLRYSILTVYDVLRRRLRHDKSHPPHPCISLVLASHAGDPRRVDLEVIEIILHRLLLVTTLPPVHSAVVHAIRDQRLLIHVHHLDSVWLHTRVPLVVPLCHLARD